MSDVLGYVVLTRQDGYVPAAAPRQPGDPMTFHAEPRDEADRGWWNVDFDGGHIWRDRQAADEHAVLIGIEAEECREADAPPYEVQLVELRPAPAFPRTPQHLGADQLAADPVLDAALRSTAFALAAVAGRQSDFGGALSLVLALTERLFGFGLTDGRPGSWEAEHVDQLVRGAQL